MNNRKVGSEFAPAGSLQLQVTRKGSDVSEPTDSNIASDANVDPNQRASQSSLRSPTKSSSNKSRSPCKLSPDSKSKARQSPSKKPDVDL